ncbi:MAG TPA: copper transporter, partial [Actinomycetota bacterium]|nr:copper transporter [Actinomycetota bacterium]
MISLRYHIVSLVAVFLALALGIVVGSTVLQEGTVSVLRATSEQVRQQSERNSRENVALKQEISRLQSFGTTVLPELVQDRLKGRSVVLVDTDKVDSGMRDAVRKVLEDAGARVDGQITFADDRL